MKFIYTLLTVIIFSGCAGIQTQEKNNAVNPIERKHYGSWEKQIGYTQVVKVGNRLLISGTTGEGDTMEEQVKSVYQTIEKILKDYHTDSSRIVKELVFTKDIEAFKSTMALRKTFFPQKLYPSSSWVQVDRMFIDSLMVEIEFEVELP